MESDTRADAQLAYPLWTKDYIFICLINLAIFMGLQILMPTLPAFVDRLGGSDFQVGLVISIFTVSAMLIRPWVGILLDSGKRKIVLLTGLIIFFISALSYNLITSIVLLLIIRFIHGLGWGTCTTSAGTVAADIIPSPRMGEGMGYFGLATALSMATAPAAGIFIIQNFSFTVLFFTSAALVLCGIILALFIQSPQIESTSSTSKPVLYEKSAIIPSLVMLFVTTTFGSIISFIILYAQQQGISNIGPFFTVFAIVMLFSRPVSGILVDKKGYNLVVIPGLILIILTMITISVASSMWIFILAAAFYGMGFGSVQPSMQALAVRNIEPARRGAANGTFFSAFDLGVGAGSLIWGIVAQFAGYSTMYAMSAIPGLAAFILYLLSTNMLKKRN